MMGGTWDAMAWGKKLPLTPPAKALLFCLCDYVGPDNVCWVGQETLAKDASMSARTVRRYLAKWEADGMITREVRMRKYGRGRTSDVITLNVGWFPDRKLELVKSDNTNQKHTNTHDQPDTLSGKSTTNRTPRVDQPDTAVSREVPVEVPGRTTTNSGRGPQEDSVAPLRYEDDFDRPRGGDDDGWDAPKKSSAARRSKPAARLANQFHDEWLTASEKREKLSLAFGTRVPFYTNLNRLLEEHTEDEIGSMITVFFQMVTAGTISLRADYLWKDFLAQRGVLWNVVCRQSTPTIDSDADEHNRRLLEQRTERTS